MQRLVEELSKVTDSRRQWGHLRHKLGDILVMGFLTIVCNGEDFTDMEHFGIDCRPWLEMFLELPNCIPDSDIFRRVFERVNSQNNSQNMRGLYVENNVKYSGQAVRGYF